ncbi:unnamed protein product [Dicrocoelium dendriticum]|nr:unnamed protein product [Dicrocoelium dendriticum]
MDRALCALVLLVGLVEAPPIGLGVPKLKASTYTPSCHMTYSGSDNGSIQSPKMAEVMAFCNYDITVNSNSQIKLKFTETNASYHIVK